MPKITRASPDEKTMAEAIRTDFGGTFVLSLAQVGKVIGARSPNTTREWVTTLVPRWRNGRRVWLVSDVAEKLCSTMERQVAV